MNPSDYCRRCDGYSAEVGKPNDDGLCPACAEVERLHTALGSIIVNLDGEGADGNIFPAAALRIAREALASERRKEASDG